MRRCEDVATTAKEDWRHGVTFAEDEVTILIGRKRLNWHELEESLGRENRSVSLNWRLKHCNRRYRLQTCVGMSVVPSGM